MRSVPVKVETIAYTTVRTKITHIQIDESHRARLPIHTPSVMAGVKGGIAGGAAMIVPAVLYGLIGYHSIWYAVNLLAAGGFVSWAGESNAFLAQFHLKGLLAASAIHGLTSVLIGLLFPNFQLFNFADGVGAGVAVPGERVARVALYALGYVAGACALSVYSFRKREI